MYEYACHIFLAAVCHCLILELHCLLWLHASLWTCSRWAQYNFGWYPAWLMCELMVLTCALNCLRNLLGVLCVLCKRVQVYPSWSCHDCEVVAWLLTTFYIWFIFASSKFVIVFVSFCSTPLVSSGGVPSCSDSKKLYSGVGVIGIKGWDIVSSVELASMGIQKLIKLELANSDYMS